MATFNVQAHHMIPVASWDKLRHHVDGSGAKVDVLGAILNTDPGSPDIDTMVELPDGTYDTVTNQRGFFDLQSRANFITLGVNNETVNGINRAVLPDGTNVFKANGYGDAVHANGNSHPNMNRLIERKILEIYNAKEQGSLNDVEAKKQFYGFMSVLQDSMRNHAAGRSVNDQALLMGLKHGLQILSPTRTLLMRPRNRFARAPSPTASPVTVVI